MQALYTELLRYPKLFEGSRWIEQYERYEYTAEPFAAFVNYELSDLVEKIVGKSLVPTYAFPVLYESGGHINPHRDVKDNFYSLSYSVASEPPGQQIGSALVFVDTPSNSISLDDPRTRVLNVPSEINRGTLYIGPEIVHWRTPLPVGVRLAQIIFAFRPIDQASCVSQ